MAADRQYQSSGLFKYLVLFTAIVVFVTLSFASYSESGYTLVKYPGVDGEYIICVDGEVSPTNQSVTIINDDSRPTVNPHVTINGENILFDLNVSDKGVRKRIDALRLGCNKVSYAADTNTRFKVKLDYMSHWRPKIEYLEIKNLLVGSSSRYFIFTDRPGEQAILVSRLNITDINTREDRGRILDAEFNGTAVRFRIDQAGSFKAQMQVFDGYVWSDLYESRFLAHVIQTDERREAVKTYSVPDESPIMQDAIIPFLIKPDDGPIISSKRAFNGGYMLLKGWADQVKSWIPTPLF